MENTIAILRANLTKKGLDAALLTGAVSIRYYSGFTSSDGTVLVTKNDAYLVTDFRYTIQAKEQTRGCAQIVEAPYAEQLDRIRGFLEQDGCKSCGYEQNQLTVAAFSRYEAIPVAWEPFGDEIALPRLHKSAAEVASLQKAQRIADRSYSEWLARVRPGMTEREAAAELDYICAKNGSEGPSFETIVAGGPNGAMCHAIPGGRKLRKGDLVVTDFGCIADGYHSDMTRTFGIGAVDDESRRIYEIVLAAQLRALEALKGGISGRALDAVAREYIAECGYDGTFGHSLGHGFGLEIHEPPRASVTSDDTLEPGMTITVEPGIYVEGKCGVRTEDCCVVTETGHLNLVSTAKDLLLI